MKLHWILPVLLLGTVLVSGCIGQSGTETSVPNQIESAGEVKTFEITAKQWAFTPSTITLNKGDKVKLKITSIDVTHGFTISEFGINAVLEPGNTVNVEFVADKTGTFSFWCSVPCGAGHSGMRGQLIVK